MKKLLLASAIVLSLPTAKAQLALQNFNAAGIPSGWTMITDSKPVSTTITPAYIITRLNATAWAKFPRSGTDSLIMSTSFYATSANADRWLITPAFNVTSANMFLKYLIGDLSGTGTSPVEILVGPGTATVAGDFTTVSTYACTPGLTTSALNLGSYNGTSIRVAFRNKGKDQGFPALDDVETVILPSNEMGLTSISPVVGSLQSYGTTSSTIPVTGNVKNNGASTITSYKVSYQVGTSPVVSETKSVSIPALGTAAFSMATPITLTATNQVVKVWVELTGDADKTNDTLKTSVAGYTTKPTKKILAEEATGTWCGYCPRGAIYMDSIHKVYPNNWSIVAVHNADPMTVASYDSYIGQFIGGYPAMVIDRRIENDPSTVFTYNTSELGKFGVANMTITPTVTGSNVTIKVDVTPTVSTNADYRLALVLTEDRVKGYDQVNYYSVSKYGAGAATGPMGNSEFNFVALPSPVPGATMRYDFVGRGIYPSPTGAAGSLPMTMTSGSTYSYTFPAVTLDPSWNKNQMKAIVLLINAADESVLNTNNQKITNVSIKEANVGINGLDVYPNPANDIVTAHFSLEQTSNVAIEIVDMLGRVAKTVSNKSLTPGTYEVPTSVSELVAGIYFVKITTESGTITERISVIK